MVYLVICCMFCYVLVWGERVRRLLLSTGRRPDRFFEISGDVYRNLPKCWYFHWKGGVEGGGGGVREGQLFSKNNENSVHSLQYSFFKTYKNITNPLYKRIQTYTNHVKSIWNIIKHNKTYKTNKHVKQMHAFNLYKTCKHILAHI